MNKRLEKIEESLTVQIADFVRDLERKGRKVIKLQTGDPDFETPPPVIEAAYNAIKKGLTHYSQSRGIPELRAAISRKFKDENGVEYDADKEILVTCGGVHGVFCALNSVTNTGDEVLIVDPSWMPYDSVTNMLGGVPVRIQTEPENNFKLTPDLLREHINNRTRVFILNSPCNPSGAVYSEEELREFASILAKYDITVISDEVYERIIFDGLRNTSFASLPGMRERTITINSFSKTYAMTGWRLGYVGAPAKILSNMLKSSQYTITHVPPFLQYGALEALTNSRVNDYVNKFVEAYRSRREFLIVEFDRLNINYIKPDGAFYFLLKVRDAQSWKDLLEKYSISCIPAESFGDCCKGYFRITFSVSDEILEMLIERLKTNL